MHRPPIPLLGLALLATSGLALLPAMDAQATSEGAPPPTGEALYLSSCAACHGVDGTGTAVSQLGFDVPMPDLTDCNFTSREPKGDWAGVAAEGGPLRGFSPIMPAFGDALSEGEVRGILDHVYGMCDEPERYPRGEFNLPRPMWTAKAYVEDETIFTLESATDGTVDFSAALTYERRFGTRNNWEIKVPWKTVETTDGAVTGIGDVALAAKRVLVANPTAGSIVSAVAEIILPVGNADRGLGKGYAIAEPFVAWGQILPAGAFLHTQLGGEIPLAADHGQEAFIRAALGKTFTVGAYGRAYSPMVGVHSAYEIGAGEAPSWAVAPQLHLTLNQRQHVMLVAGAKIPVTDFDPSGVEARLTLLWDWFDGGFFEGW